MSANDNLQKSTTSTNSSNIEYTVNDGGSSWRHSIEKRRNNTLNDRDCEKYIRIKRQSIASPSPSLSPSQKEQNQQPIPVNTQNVIMAEALRAKLTGNITKHDEIVQVQNNTNKISTKTHVKVKNTTKESKCIWCQNSRENNNTIQYIGKNQYIGQKTTRYINQYHIYITSIDHIPSQLDYDQSIIEELNNFKLLQSNDFKLHDMGFIFMETVLYNNIQNKEKNILKTSFGELEFENNIDTYDKAQSRLLNKFEGKCEIFIGKQHSIIECIPQRLYQLKRAPLFFHRSLLEMETINRINKTIIDTSIHGIYKSIPHTHVLSYFFVEFGIHGNIINKKKPSSVSSEIINTNKKYYPIDGYALAREIDDTDKEYSDIEEEDEIIENRTQYPLGYAHIIEEQKFSKDFGLEIICSIIGEPAQMVIRQSRRSLSDEDLCIQKLRTILTSFNFG